MASKVGNILKVMGHYNYEPGAHLYHAADSTKQQGGLYPKEKRDRIRKALFKLRLRATGMTDDLGGAKESDGTLDNKFEQTPKR